jgi:Zn-dependent M28 family amino/carboxypeptidase
MEKRPLAVVCISLSFDYLVPIIEDWDFVIPSITVPPNVGLKLVDHLDQKLKISIRSEISPGQANNIVGRLGSPDDSRIVLMAHFDTKPYTPGAFDNGAGIAILLALAKSLSQRRDLKIGLEFVAFNGEEYGLGGYPYLEQFGLAPVPFGTETPWKRSALDLVQLAINVDGVGTKLDATTISIAEVSSALEDRINAMLSEKNNFLIVPMWPASNHYDFYTHHVPTVAFNSVGTSNFIHTEHDSLRWLNVDILAEIIVLINELVDLVNTRPKNWGRQ